MFKNDKRNLPFGHSAAVLDSKCVLHLESFRPNLSNILLDNNIVDQFCEEYYKWLLHSNNHRVQGLEEFKHQVYSLGTSESFDKFYMKNKSKRFRCFKTEYMYHQLAWRNAWPDWQFIEDCDITENDAVVISLPFADTGDIHLLHTNVLETCNKLNVPVLIDLCYFSIATDIDIDLRYPCITDIVFSLSKAFPVAHARIGMRLTRVDDDDTLFVYQKSFYNNRLGAAIGLELVKNFSCDYIPTTYKKKQQEFCNTLGIAPSKTVLFGIAQDKWHEYNRGGLTNRLSFHNFLNQDIDTFKGVINGSSIK